LKNALHGSADLTYVNEMRGLRNKLDASTVTAVISPGKARRIVILHRLLWQVHTLESDSCDALERPVPQSPTGKESA